MSLGAPGALGAHHALFADATGLNMQLSHSTHAFVWTLSLSNVLYDFTIRSWALSLT